MSDQIERERASEQTLSLLEEATREHKNNPDDPKRLTDLYITFWAKYGQIIGKICTVDTYPLGSREIREGIKKEQRDIFKPANVSLVDLGRMFPKMGGWAVAEGNSVVDTINNSGWLRIEASVDAPNRNTTQGQLEEKFRKERKQGQSLRTYIIGGQTSKLLTDKYFDQGINWSRLPGSCRGGRVLDSRFHSVGSLYVYSHLHPGYRHEFIGGRSEEVIKP